MMPESKLHSISLPINKYKSIIYYQKTKDNSYESECLDVFVTLLENMNINYRLTHKSYKRFKHC